MSALAPSAAPVALMRAAILDGPRQARLAEVGVPEPGPGEVRVRLTGSGVCASSVPVWQGRPWFEYPQAPGSPGHEGWGVVDALGEGVRTLRLGDPVALMSFRAFAEYDVTAAEAVVRLPGALEGKIFPGEAIGCAMNVLHRSEILSGKTVVVVGVGFLGALLVSLASGAGARVLAISRRRFALGVAERMGAHEVHSLEDACAAASWVMRRTGNAGAQRVIEAAGMQITLDLAADVTGVRGRLIIAGYHQDGPRQVNMQQWNWRGFDVINAHERDPGRYAEGIAAAASAVARGELDPSPLYTHRFPLEEVGSALDAASARPEGFMKGVVLA